LVEQERQAANKQLVVGQARNGATLARQDYKGDDGSEITVMTTMMMAMILVQVG
jgi:hypothetical protein